MFASLATMLALRAREAGHEDIAIDASLRAEAFDRWLEVPADPDQRRADLEAWDAVQARAKAVGL